MLKAPILPQSAFSENPDLPELTCQACGLIAIPDVHPRGPHLGAYCPDCGRWIKWLPKPKVNWRSLPATEKQLAFLTRHGKARPGLSRGKASDLIEMILKS